MFTTCTHCNTRFRLAAEQLKAAQGHVRCGQCQQVFDAYENLEGASVPPQRPPQVPLEDTADLPMEAADEAVSQLGAPLQAEDEPITSAPALQAGPRRLKADVPIDDLFAELMDEMDALPAEAPTAAAPSGVVEPVMEMEMDAIGVEPAPSYAHVDALAAPPRPPRRRPLLGALGWFIAVILLLVLGAQLVNLNRVALSQNAVVGSSLQALYAALGWPIVKPSAVSAWTVGALNVTTDPDSAGALSITGSLVNQAAFPQPWPLLRVILTDRFGEALRARDFKPADYLPAGQAALPPTPGAAVRVRLDVVDPGADAVGFSLTPCYDAPAGRVCAAATLSD